jgi:spore photoproduct lyase
MRKYVSFYAEKPVRELPEFAAIASRFPDIQWIDNYQTFSQENVTREKQSLIFARKRGAWLKPFHCYDQAGYTFMSLDLAEGCLFDCVYCYLQSYLNHGALVLFLDRESLLSELAALPSGRCWISTGLLSDSLLSENQHSYLPEISRSLPEGCVLELRSKGADLTPIAKDQIRRERVVLSWSLNPPEIIRTYEYGTASLERRLQAARDAMELGYRVAFHLDPVFHFDGWEQAYRLLFDQLEQFPREKCAFVSVGLFRYMPELGSIIRQRFPYHPVLSAEFFPGEDGKYHYFRSIRREMYRTFEDWLKPWKETPVFWSQRI